MERLRHVARAGRSDAAAIVVETVEALVRLQPDASELVPLCRNLVERHPACGPLWWLCSRLLADPAALAQAWELAGDIEHDPTVTMLADRLPDDGTVMTVGHPMIVAAALCDRPDVRLLAVDTGSRGRGFVRRLDVFGAVADVVAPEAILATARRADVVLVEAEACCTETAVATIGGGLAAVAAASVGAPVWLVVARGRRLPSRYVDAIAARVTGGAGSDFETFCPELAELIAGPAGVVPRSPAALAPECPAVPELVPS